MQTFTSLPYGYRWFTPEEITEYDDAVTAGGRLWGWMRDEYVGVVVPTATDKSAGYVRQWGCMIEFGMDHDHDAVECERTMDYMHDPFGGFDFSDDPYADDDHYERFGRPALPNEY